MGWLAEQGRAFRDRIEFGTLDLSGPYRHVFEVMVPNATLVADPSTSPSSPTPSSTSAAGGCRTRRSATGDGSPIRSTGAGVC